MRVSEFKPRPVAGRHQPVIALVGCDGSGKSTVGAALLELLQAERPTVFCHLGKQAGNLERTLAPLPFIGPYVTGKARKENGRIQSGKKAGALAAISGFVLSMRRVWRFGVMRCRHERGLTILTDRYPQNVVPGPMDGPTLANLNRDGVFIWLFSRVERGLYGRMARFRPDVVIRLNVDLETALQRKPDHVPFKLARKIDDLSKLEFAGAPIVDIDGTEPLEQVLEQAEETVRRVLALYPHGGTQDRRAGKLVSLVGCDGSGKSSISQYLVQHFSETRPTVYGYLGLGSGDLGRRIGALPVIGQALEKKLNRKARKARTKGEKMPGMMTGLVLFAFSLVRMKRFLRVRRAVEKGFLVVTDRYPQVEIPGQCDGPGLSAAYSNNPLIRVLARLERTIYHRIAAFRPDLIIRLNVDAETAHGRKPDHDLEALKVKTELMPKLNFNHAPLVEVDARQSYEVVQQEVLDLLKAHEIV
ncbi:hypothetical protein NQF87_05545 [Bombella sp. TMW 2.2559]|uniref:Thymidylate kinase n=1 Tax=Bombella dulcis TaxID=2967339 RepID=A0ABT3WHU7_9PROT|nr:hypothetical protein [Bombella dulcis]MCX5616436.1 hypothetical protein [Bombella dulcis]